MPEIRVFISSTSEDLSGYRAAARDVVHRQGGDWKAVWMEDFGARGSLGIKELCEKAVLECDLVLGIIAWQRGSIVPVEKGGDGIRSYAAYEIEAAQKAGIPTLLLLADEDWPGRLLDRGEALDWVEGFREDLNRSADFFAYEREESGLPAFRAKAAQALINHRQRNLRAGLPPPAELPVELRTWEWPELPEDPYPKLGGGRSGGGTSSGLSTA